LRARRSQTRHKDVSASPHRLRRLRDLLSLCSDFISTSSRPRAQVREFGIFAASSLSRLDVFGRSSSSTLSYR